MLQLNKLLEPPELKTNPLPLTIEDEYNLDKRRGLMEQRKRMMIRAEYGGCCKSYTCEAMLPRGHPVLFVCPHEQGGEQIRVERLHGASLLRHGAV